MLNIKRFFSLACVVGVLFLCVISAFAYPAVNPSGSEIGGALTSSQVVSLSEAVTAECYFINASTVTTGASGAKYPLMITARSIADQWTYYVYIGDSSASVSDIPEDWGRPGASVNIGVTYIYRCSYNFSASGGMGYQSAVFASNGVLTLASDEQIIYLFKGSGIGLNDSIIFPTIDTLGSGFIAPKRWINALSAFDGSLSPEINRANYNLGYADGQSDGFSNGYNAGYNYLESKLPDYTDTAYANGYTAGDTAGYNRAIAQLGAGDDVSYSLDIPLIITSIPAAAKTIINNALGFEIFGINVAGLLSALVVVVILIWTIHKVVKK